VIPFSFYEVANNAYFNSLTVIDANGELLGLYRKSHIPDGPGYQEKFYFSPGDTGFKVFRTEYGVIGVGICWDQVIAKVYLFHVTGELIRGHMFCCVVVPRGSSMHGFNGCRDDLLPYCHRFGAKEPCIRLVRTLGTNHGGS
jgi:hypothetical protein